MFPWITNRPDIEKPSVPCVIKMPDDFSPRYRIATWANKDRPWTLDDGWTVSDQFVTHFAVITEPSDATQA